jgi:hypothetical protein
MSPSTADNTALLSHFESKTHKSNPVHWNGLLFYGQICRQTHQPDSKAEDLFFVEFSVKADV